MGEREELLALAAWCETERYKLGAVDGYDYRSGEEAGLRYAQIEAEKRAKAISAPAQSPLRCEVTGNPVGTDTIIIGAAACQCKGCAALRAPEAADVGAVAWRMRYSDHKGGFTFWTYHESKPDPYRKAEIQPLYASPAADAGMRERDNERLKFALKTARNHLITLGGDGRPDPNADQLQAAILDLIDATLPSTVLCSGDQQS